MVTVAVRNVTTIEVELVSLVAEATSLIKSSSRSIALPFVVLKPVFCWRHHHLLHDDLSLLFSPFVSHVLNNLQECHSKLAFNGSFNVYCDCSHSSFPFLSFPLSFPLWEPQTCGVSLMPTNCRTSWEKGLIYHNQVWWWIKRCHVNLETLVSHVVCSRNTLRDTVISTWRDLRRLVEAWQDLQEDRQTFAPSLLFLLFLSTVETPQLIPKFTFGLPILNDSENKSIFPSLFVWLPSCLSSRQQLFYTTVYDIKICMTHW